MIGKQASTTRILAHELGHCVDSHFPPGPKDESYVIDMFENSIMYDLYNSGLSNEAFERVPPINLDYNTLTW